MFSASLLGFGVAPRSVCRSPRAGDPGWAAATPFLSTLPSSRWASSQLSSAGPTGVGPALRLRLWFTSPLSPSFGFGGRETGAPLRVVSSSVRVPYPGAACVVPGGTFAWTPLLCSGVRFVRPPLLGFVFCSSACGRSLVFVVLAFLAGGILKVYFKILFPNFLFKFSFHIFILLFESIPVDSIG